MIRAMPDAGGVQAGVMGRRQWMHVREGCGIAAAVVLVGPTAAGFSLRRWAGPAARLSRAGTGVL
jgi:hypothetical protein